MSSPSAPSPSPAASGQERLPFGVSAQTHDRPSRREQQLMTTGTASDLALLGGAPVRQTPLPTPPRATGPQALDNLRRVLESGLMNRAAGVWVKRLEEEFGTTYGARHCTASTSGTSAIHVAVGA